MVYQNDSLGEVFHFPVIDNDIHGGAAALRSAGAMLPPCRGEAMLRRKKGGGIDRRTPKADCRLKRLRVDGEASED